MGLMGPTAERWRLLRWRLEHSDTWVLRLSKNVEDVWTPQTSKHFICTGFYRAISCLRVSQSGLHWNGWGDWTPL